MKTMKIVLSTLPCSLVCADSLLLSVMGLSYMGVWLWIVYECMEAYGRKNRADEKAD